MIAMATMAAVNMLGTAVAAKKANDRAKSQYKFNNKIRDIETNTSKSEIEEQTSFAKASVSQELADQSTLATTKALANPNLNSEVNLSEMQGGQARIEQSAEMAKSNLDIKQKSDKMKVDYQAQVAKTQGAMDMLGTVNSGKSALWKSALGSATSMAMAYDNKG